MKVLLLFYFFNYQPDNSLNEVMKNLEGWRAALIRINTIVQWEKPYHPVLLLAPTTLTFL